MARSILLTGGTGFIGVYTVREMISAREPITVTVYDSQIDRKMLESVVDLSEAPSDLELVQGDVLDLANMLLICKRRNVDTIVHLGAMKRAECGRNPALATQVNCVGTNNALECGRILGLRRVVYASSAMVFGLDHYGETEVVANDARFYADNAYGASKIYNEAMGKIYHKDFGVSTIGLRFNHGTGAGRIRGASVYDREFIDKPALGQPSHIQHADSLENYMSVDDMATSIMAAIDATEEAAGQSFNIAGTDIRPRREAIAFVKRLLPEWQCTAEPGHFGRPCAYDLTETTAKLNWRPRHGMEEILLSGINRVRRNNGLPEVSPA